MKAKRVAVPMLTFVVGTALVAAGMHRADSDSEQEAIKQTALDYIEGWYEGNSERMERSLHPELSKRVQWFDARSGGLKIDHMGAMRLVQRTRARGEKSQSASEQQRDVEVLDVFGNAASVKVVANDWIDYLHLTRLDGRWQIVNVLWELKPEAKERYGFPSDS